MRTATEVVPEGPPRPEAPGARGLALAAAGTTMAGLAMLEPRLELLALPGFVLAAVGAELARHTRRAALTLLLALVSVGWVAATRVEPSFGADSPSYYVQLRTLAFDRNLDTSDEWAHWGFEPRRTSPTGLPTNAHTVGPAVIWSPFFALAHLVVLAGHMLGMGGWDPDGYSAPYVRSAAMGTMAVGVSGAFVLARVLVARFTLPAAMLAVGAGVLGTPILYYLLLQPAMAHGLEFGLAAALLAVLLAEKPRWPLAGLLFGLLVCVRPQAIVYVLLVAGCALADLRAKRTPLWTVSLGALLAFVAFQPQMRVWDALYGNPLAGPSADTMDWSAPHMGETLFSADRGLFPWTPIALLGLTGLVLLSVRRLPLVARLALLVFLATAWVNGSVVRFTGDRAFGARRYALVVPLLALGLAQVFMKLESWARQHPSVFPATVGLLFVSWNLGLVGLYRGQEVERTATLELVAAGQSRLAYGLVEGALGAVAGDRGRGLAYRLFVGEYLYQNVYTDNLINLSTADPRHLRGGWSRIEASKDDGPRFRFALAPRACVVLPLQGPMALAPHLRWRAVRGAMGPVAVTVNGVTLASLLPGPEWSEVPIEIPAERVHAGANELCVESSGLAEGERFAAVSAVRLP